MSCHAIWASIRVQSLNWIQVTIPELG